MTSTLHFEVALANAQVLGKETVRSMANRRNQRGDRRVLVAVNGGFGVLGDMRGYGGVLENLHIQDGELITQPTDAGGMLRRNRVRRILEFLL